MGFCFRYYSQTIEYRHRLNAFFSIVQFSHITCLENVIGGFTYTKNRFRPDIELATSRAQYNLSKNQQFVKKEVISGHGEEVCLMVKITDVYHGKNRIVFLVVPLKR